MPFAVLVINLQVGQHARTRGLVFNYHPSYASQIRSFPTVHGREVPAIVYQSSEGPDLPAHTKHVNICGQKSFCPCSECEETIQSAGPQQLHEHCVFCPVDYIYIPE